MWRLRNQKPIVEGNDAWRELRINNCEVFEAIFFREKGEGRASNKEFPNSIANMYGVNII
jgi:hypothetical protein